MDPLFDANKEEGEQDFDENSRPVSRPVLLEEEKDESNTATPEDKTPCHVPIEDAMLAKIKVDELR